jgi:hypothetical protein
MPKGGRKVVRINALGLLHRLHIDTLPTDVHMLLPVLQCYTLEMLAIGYTQHCLLSAFKMFLKHPKIIVCCQPWRDLYLKYAAMLKTIRQTKGVSNTPTP